MADMMAIVSKAAFDALRPVPTLGTTTALDGYDTKKERLRHLGGAHDRLFLVTVRPGDRLWLLAVLEGATHDGKRWRATANRIETRDVTFAVPTLRFDNGKGLPSESGKLAMALQTPRTLTQDDAATLLGTRPEGAEPSAETESATGEKTKPAVGDAAKRTKATKRPAGDATKRAKTTKPAVEATKRAKATKRATTTKPPTRVASTPDDATNDTPGIALSETIRRAFARELVRARKRKEAEAVARWVATPGGSVDDLLGFLSFWGAFRACRLAVHEAAPADRAVATAAAREASAALDLGRRAVLAYVFDDPAWVDAVATEALAAPTPSSAEGWDAYLWTVARDARAAVSLVEKASSAIRYYGRYAAPDVLLRHDAKDAATILLALLDRAERDKWSPGDVKVIAELAACIDDARVATWLAEHAHLKPFEKLVVAYFEGHPAHVTVLEARAAQAKGKVATELTRLVDSVRRATSTSAPTKRVAPKDAMPAVLREKPWTSVRPRPRRTLPSRADTFELGDLSGFPVYSASARWASPERDAETLAKVHEHPYQLAGGLVPTLMGLTDAGVVALLEAHVDRVQVSSARDLQGIAGRLGAAGARALVGIAARDPITHLEVLLRSRSQRTAQTLARLVAHKPFEAARVEAWTVANLPVALDALLPMALGEDDADAWAAASLLFALDARGLRSRLEARADEDDARAELLALLETDSKLRFPPKLPSLPKKLDTSKLPRLVLRAGGALDDDATTSVLTMLAFSSTHTTYAGLIEVRDACTEASLDAFVGALADDWIVRGARANDDFALYAIGHLGSAELARKLERDSQAWAASRSVPLMQRALDVLALAGDDASLASLSARGLRSEFEDTRARVAALMEREAARRGLRVDALEDRLEPSFDTTPLDFGSRVFRITLDDTLVPTLLDESGATVAKLPKPGKKDDAALAKTATERWKDLDKTLASHFRHQSARFERALRTERTFTSDELRAIATRGLTGTLARRLAFEDAKGRICRLDESGQFTDAHDDTLTPSEPLRLAHPLRSDSTELAAMTRVFADYLIVQPFPQLGRATFRPEPAALASSALTTHAGRELSHESVLALLRGRGWSRTPLEDTMRRLVYELDDGTFVEVRLDPGLYFGPVKATPAQRLGPLERRPTRPGDASPTFEDVPPLLLSELLYDTAGA
ncbi:MAG: DUF4132 domain-containing protein [Polyangiales bacterium]